MNDHGVSQLQSGFDAPPGPVRACEGMPPKAVRACGGMPLDATQINALMDIQTATEALAALWGGPTMNLAVVSNAAANGGVLPVENVSDRFEHANGSSFHGALSGVDGNGLWFATSAGVVATAADAGVLVVGGAGRDYISGGAGDDVLIGNGGVDFLNGGGGDDILAPGFGDFAVSGGKGADTFLLDLQGENLQGDTGLQSGSIIDLNPAEGDRITLTGIGAYDLRAGAPDPYGHETTILTSGSLSVAINGPLGQVASAITYAGPFSGDDVLLSLRHRAGSAADMAMVLPG